MEPDQVWFFPKHDHEQIIVVAIGYVDRFRYPKRFDYVRDGVAVTDDQRIGRENNRGQFFGFAL